MLRYWSVYRASYGSPGLADFFAGGDVETNGVVIVRVGMLRLTVLNLRRALEPASPERWSVAAILDRFSADSALRLLRSTEIARLSAYATASRRVEAIETCRSEFAGLYESDDAKWLRHLRDKDIAHSGVEGGKWEDRTVDQLHEIVMRVATVALRLCDAVIGAPSAQQTYEASYHEASKFWSCFRVSDA